MFLCISCDIAPTIIEPLTFEVIGRDCDVYWQIVKDGEPDTGEYQHYPINSIIIPDVQPGDGFTLRFYNVVSTIVNGNIEQRTIDSTYETHIVIDHYTTSVLVTYTKEEGLGCRVMQSSPLPN